MAAYRNITLTSTTVEWQGSSGPVFAVTVVLNRAETDYFGNADWQPVRDGLQISTAATIDGVEHRQGVDGLRKLDKPVGAVTHAVGRIGIADAEIVAKIEAARAVAKAHPAWVAKTAAFDRGIAADRAYTAHVAAVNKMMMPGGSY